MKRMIFPVAAVAVLSASATHEGFAQKIDNERMNRDIEVAENVLGTLIQQQFSNQRMFFALEISGSYQPGYGVTFTIPADFTTPIVFALPSNSNNENGVKVFSSPEGNTNFSYERNERNNQNTLTLETRERKKQRLDMDSIRDAYNRKVIGAAKDFLVDYSDMITQLQPTEKIIITNQGTQPRVWVNQIFTAPKRTHLSVEAQRADITQYKQGKTTRDHALATLKVVNTETVDNVEQDLELLSSIFTRLYRADLSKTYFIDGNVFYERLKDFGAIYYMQALSSAERGYNRFVMPTLGLDDVDLETRNKKVTELYPRFEDELKENILEYGRTIKSLNNDEVLVFQVRISRCPSCGIPSSLEVSLKSSVLKDYAAGKIDKKAAASKFVVKKGGNQ